MTKVLRPWNDFFQKIVTLSRAAHLKNCFFKNYNKDEKKTFIKK